MNKKFLSLFSSAVVLALLLSACGTASYVLPGVTSVLPNATPIPQTQSQSQVQAAAPAAAPTLAPVAGQSSLLAAYEGTLESIYQQVNPSVVNIRVVEKQTATTTSRNGSPFPFGTPNLPGGPQGPNGQGPANQALGSGFVWDKQGYIVTNNHVVDNASKIEVTFPDESVFSAKLVGADPNSDLAVIKVDVPADRLIPVTMGDSKQVKVGELAIAIGNPFGLQGTMTVGIISALGRSLSATAVNTSGASFSIPDILQTDAPINPGNSGGVLVNDQGQVLGVTSAIESPVMANAGIGFVIPSALVQRVVPGLIKDGHYDHPYLGISGTTLFPEAASAMSLDSNLRGALVKEVTPGGPADKAGLKGSSQSITVDGSNTTVGGDVIVAVNGDPIKSMDDLIAYLFDQTSVGQKVTLTVLRNGKQTSVDATLTARPASPAADQQTTIVPASSAGVWLGISGLALNTEVARAMNLSDTQKGVLVQQVQSGTPADLAGLKGSTRSVTINGQTVMIGGDVITSVDGTAVGSSQDIRAALQNHSAGDQVTVSILRDGQSMDVQVTLADRPAQ